MNTIQYDLKELLANLLKEQPSIERIHAFGSRAYGTGSTRYDCHHCLNHRVYVLDWSIAAIRGFVPRGAS